MDSDDLYEKLKLIYKNKELREKLALSGKEKADKCFDSEKQFKELKNILLN
jgi:hypothetical protein